MDPPCLIRVEGLPEPILLPLSHQMPLYRSRHPRYDRVPMWLAHYIRDTRGSLRMIDVGANVGDTVLATIPCRGDRYLALEPHPRYFPFLASNMSAIETCTALQLACGETEGELDLAGAARGTAGPAFGASTSVSVRQRPLDAIWSEVWHGGEVDFLKIDTDGFDVQVLRGGRALMRAQRPWVFYECDTTISPDAAELHLGAFELMRELGYLRGLAFDNFGALCSEIDFADTECLSQLIASQSRNGPVYYHDILAAPNDTDLGRFKNRIP
jgi:FkbM family methyltransferase